MSTTADTEDVAVTVQEARDFLANMYYCMWQ